MTARDLSALQRAPAPGRYQSAGIRRGNSLGGSVADQTRFTAGQQEDTLGGDTWYPGGANDVRVVRDRTVFFSDGQRSGVGSCEPDWTMAGPARMELSTRTQTYRRMAGTDRTRAFQSPIDPRLGLHTRTQDLMGKLGSYGRISAGAPTQRGVRVDRLSAPRATGNTYSQTTLVQGASGAAGIRRTRRRP